PLHLVRRAEEPIRWRQSVDALMRPRKIVTVDEQANALARVAEIEEERGLDALAPQRAPEAFDLAERLRPVRRRHDLLDAAFLAILGEGALAAPRHVLRAVVGEHFLGGAAPGDRRPPYFEHQRRRLAGMQTVADDEAAVIVEKGDEIDA